MVLLSVVSISDTKYSKVRSMPQNYDWSEFLVRPLAECIFYYKLADESWTRFEWDFAERIRRRIRASSILVEYFIVVVVFISYVIVQRGGMVWAVTLLVDNPVKLGKKRSAFSFLLLLRMVLFLFPTGGAGGKECGEMTFFFPIRNAATLGSTPKSQRKPSKTYYRPDNLSKTQ